MKSFYMLFAYLLLFSCGKREIYFLTQGEIFNTITHIKYRYHRDLGKEISARLDSFDLSLNPFNKHSVIYKVNHNEAIEIDDWFITVFRKAQEIARLSGGYYDITCAPLINLWGFGFSKPTRVTPAVIDSLKQFIGYQKIRLVGRQIVKDDPRMQLNASSIAKGYAVDVTAELLDSFGITDYLIEIGGEIRTKGKNPAGKCWSIEILKPVDDVTGQICEQQEIICLDNYAMATSGNYRNFYICDRRKYSHIINPLTGYPEKDPLLSASVFAPTCMIADALATAFMTMGLRKAVALADRMLDVDYLFVFANENGTLMEKRSRGFEKYLNMR